MQTSQDKVAKLEEAAGLGDTDAMVSLGYIHGKGKGVPQDRKKALEWYRMAFKAGNPQGAIGSEALLFPVNDSMSSAAKQLRAAFDSEESLNNPEREENSKSQPSTASPDASNSLRTEKTSGLHEKSTMNDVVPAASVAPHFVNQSIPRSSAGEDAGGKILSFERATEQANLGDAYAQAVLSIYYGLGYKTERDVAKSAAYALKSAAQGHPLGVYRVGLMRQTGEGMGKNEAQGRTLKSKAFDGLNALSGDPYALTALGVMVFQGDVVRQDKIEAARLYRLAADQGYAPAQYNYASCLISGQGTEKDEEKANEYWQAAFQQNYPPALSGPPR
jgi:TPR repeat protein